MIRINQFLKQYVLLISLFTLSYVGAIAQKTSAPIAGAQASLSEYTEKLYGTNDVLVNGRSYIPFHYNAKGHPYFLSKKCFSSSLIINGKKYDNQEILYNIDIEKIILNTTIDNGEKVLLVLNSEFIDSFNIGEHNFLNGAKYFPEGKFPGFVELVYKGSFSVLIQHQKSFVTQYTTNTPNGFFSGLKSTNYISNKGGLTKLATKKNLLDYFPEHKKEIKKFIRNNNIKFKQANTAQLNNLFSYCDYISSK